MAINDAFTAQIVQLVREMPDDAILALVRNQLGAVTSVALGSSKSAPAAATRTSKPRKVKVARAKAAPKRATAKPAVAKPVAPAKAKKVTTRKVKATKRGSSPKVDALSLVEKIVKSGNGLAASQVAKAAGVPQSRAAAALKELKLARRIFQGGDRRFARYAGDPRTAEAASLHARRTASGPIVGKAKRR